MLNAEKQTKNNLFIPRAMDLEAPALPRLHPRRRGTQGASVLQVALEFSERLSKEGCRRLGPFFMALGVGLVGFVAFSLIAIEPVVPYRAPGEFAQAEHDGRDTGASSTACVTSLWKVLVLDGIGVFFAANALFNWVMCAVTHPGRTPGNDTKMSHSHNISEDSEVLADSGRAGVHRRPINPQFENSGVEGSAGPQSGRCGKCLKVKPPRSHHCGICGECILAMDHHCPWVNNCVGFYNYRYFYLFMFWLWLACFYVVILFSAFHPVWDEVGLDSFMMVRVREQNKSKHGNVSRLRMFCFVLCFAIDFALGILLGFHTYLICTARTTIEFHLNKLESTYGRYEGRILGNEFDLGVKRNWELVFGRSKFPFYWARISFRKPPGNGISWPSARSVILQQHEIV